VITEAALGRLLCDLPGPVAQRRHEVDRSAECGDVRADDLDTGTLTAFDLRDPHLRKAKDLCEASLVDTGCLAHLRELMPTDIGLPALPGRMLAHGPLGVSSRVDTRALLLTSFHLA
jgi:hypothetical protein